MNGYLVEGRDDTYESDNSVFLPAAGNCNHSDVSGQGYDGYYWSSTPFDSSNAYCLYFNSGGQYVSSYYCSGGYSVRAVLAED